LKKKGTKEKKPYGKKKYKALTRKQKKKEGQGGASGGRQTNPCSQNGGQTWKII